MIVVDVNLLINAENADDSRHDKARTWWDAQLSGEEPVRYPWLTIIAFLRITTARNVMPFPLSGAAAVERVNSWLAQPNVGIADPGVRHPQILSELVNKHKLTGNMMTDAHLAAISIEQDCVLCTADSDFSRFPELKWRNPLIADAK
jgi:uncharacterized protein